MRAVGDGLGTVDSVCFLVVPWWLEPKWEPGWLSVDVIVVMLET